MTENVIEIQSRTATEMMENAAVMLQNLIPSVELRNCEQLETSVCMATETKEYYNILTLLTEVWQHTEE